jgi:hypothetical protein
MRFAEFGDGSTLKVILEVVVRSFEILDPTPGICVSRGTKGLRASFVQVVETKDLGQ